MERRTHDFWVTLNDTHAEEWKHVLGEGVRRLPVRSPVPCLATLPGFSVPQRVFLLALDQMEPDQVSRIAKRLADKFGLSEEESAAEVSKAGIPIREEHTNCTIVHNPQRWF